MTIEREKLLEQRIREIEERFKEFQNSLNTKGKGRGKKSVKKSTESLTTEQIDEEARKRLRSFLESDKSSNESASCSYSSFPKPSAPPYENEPIADG